MRAATSRAHAHFKQIHDARETIEFTWCFRAHRKFARTIAVACMRALCVRALRVDFISIDRNFWSRPRCIKQGWYFFLLYWCNWNAVHVDPRRHCSDIATDRG